MEHTTITTQSGIEDEEMEMADSENLDPQLQIPELQCCPKSAPPRPLNLKRKQPPPRKKDQITQRRKYTGCHQPFASISTQQQSQQQQQQQQQIQQQIQQQRDERLHATSQNIDAGPTTESVVTLATLPPINHPLQYFISRAILAGNFASCIIIFHLLQHYIITTLFFIRFTPIHHAWTGIN